MVANDLVFDDGSRWSEFDAGIHGDPRYTDVQQLKKWISTSQSGPQSGFSFNFYPKKAWEAQLQGGQESRQLESGYTVLVQPEKGGIYGKPLDSVKLERALKSAFIAAGVENPNVLRTDAGVYVDVDTIDRMNATIADHEREEGDVPASCRQFAQGFAEGEKGKGKAAV
jgi:hypothetical protein